MIYFVLGILATCTALLLWLPFYHRASSIHAKCISFTAIAVFVFTGSFIMYHWLGSPEIAGISWEWGE